MMKRPISTDNISRDTCWKKLAVMLLAISMLVLSGCADKKAETLSVEDFGFAKKITDRTVIVSVFSDAPNVRRSSGAFEADCLERLKGACEFIAEGCQSYAAKTDILYDWEKYPELKVSYQFDDDFTQSAEDIKLIEEYLKEEEKSRSALLTEYEAESILYIFYFDTDEENAVPTQCYMCTGKAAPSDEFIVMNNYVNQNREGVAAYVHELLHAFGAPDLYTTEGGFSGKITQEYVDYLGNVYHNNNKQVDIMYTVHSRNPSYNLDSYIIGQTTAYYLGLIEKENCPDAKEYGLGISTFEELH